MNRLSGWQQIGIALVVLWTLAVVTYGWMNLPRAPDIAHHPEILNKLSHEATSVLRGSGLNVKAARGEPVWSDTPRVVRMANGTQLEFPLSTTDQHIELFASEYRELLDDEAAAQRWQYLILLLAIWSIPVLLILAAALIGTHEWSRTGVGNEQNKSRPRPTLA